MRAPGEQLADVDAEVVEGAVVVVRCVVVRVEEVVAVTMCPDSAVRALHKAYQLDQA